MSNLILDSLEIQNFRAFRHLRIERLGRVNLITGKNNVGKTCLLEALWLYARGGVPWQLLELLNVRDEMRTFAPDAKPRNAEEVFAQISSLKHLFYGRNDVAKQTDFIRIGPLNAEQQSLQIAVNPGDFEPSEETSVQSKHLLHDKRTEAVINSPYIVTLTRTGVNISYKIIELVDRTMNPYLTSPDTIISPFVRAQGWETSSLIQSWDRIALTSQEDDVYAALRIIAPNIQRLSFIGDDAGNGARGRIPIVKLAGKDEPIPLRSMGEGMNRLFGIALALASTKDGILLVDEIESGLHYSVLPEIWKLIFQMAARLNVQVFATTHSWDCVEAFQEAAQVDEHEEAVLIRLRERKGEIEPTLLDEQELSIATNEQIEVR